RLRSPLARPLSLLLPLFSSLCGLPPDLHSFPTRRSSDLALYLLDGLRATERTNAWVNDVNAARLYEPHNITLVMPIGGAASFYADWDGPAKYDLTDPVNYQWETFLTKELKGYLQRQFGVSPTNNSIAGLSMGGTAAITL